MALGNVAAVLALTTAQLLFSIALGAMTLLITAFSLLWPFIEGRIL